MAAEAERLRAALLDLYQRQNLTVGEVKRLLEAEKTTMAEESLDRRLKKVIGELAFVAKAFKGTQLAEQVRLRLVEFGITRDGKGAP